MPAPGLPLTELIHHPDLRLRHLTGDAEGRFIGMVQSSELDDPAEYLLGGELLLTAGVHFPATADAVDAYVRRLVAAGTAALGFGVAPVHAEVPTALVASCAEHGLPLLRVPPETPFVAVGRAFHLAMAEVRHRELRHVSDAQAALASAAARPDAVEAVLRQLSVRVGAWAVLLDADGTELFSAGARPPAPEPDRLRALVAATVARRSGGAPSAASDGDRLTAHTLAGAEPLVLGLAGELGPVEHQVVGVGVVLLSLLTGPRRAIGGDASDTTALVRLLLGADAARVAPLLHPSGADPSHRWLVVHARRTSSSSTADPVHVAALGTALGTSHLAIDDGVLRALVPVTDAARRGDLARLGWTLGFSAPVPATDLASADAQAARALRRALAAGTTAAHHRTEGLRGLVDPAEAEALARTRFARLATAGTPGPDVLRETLRTWLSLHGSWDRTAVALDVHRNTVRQRVTRVGELLDADLTDPDVRMELWFALRWLPG